jgi:hypothetical protein
MGEGQDRQDNAVHPLTAEQLPAVKAVIAATGLFPSELLDEMPDLSCRRRAVTSFGSWRPKALPRVPSPTAHPSA